METVVAYFDLTMEVQCPYCDFMIDLEDNDIEHDYFYLRKFGDWVTNISNVINEKEKCPSCNSEFIIGKIER